MRALAGFLVLITGIGLGLQLFFVSPVEHVRLQGFLAFGWPSFTPDMQTQSQQADDIGKAVPTANRQDRTGAFSPRLAHFRQVAHEPVPVLVAGRVPVVRVRGKQGSPDRPDRDSGDAASWLTVVELEPAAGTAAALTTLVPSGGDARYRLARQLQVELKRLGCYWGKADGSWGSGSKSAMAAFMSRVNATLPLDHPDYAMLNLVRGHRGQVCGAACGRGQTLARSGKCTAAPTILARTKPATTPASETTAVAGAVQPVRPAATVAREPLPGLMAVGGPVADPSRAKPQVPATAADTFGLTLPLPSTPPLSRPPATGHFDPSATSATWGLPEGDAGLSGAAQGGLPVDTGTVSVPRPKAKSKVAKKTRTASSVRDRLPHHRRYIPPPHFLSGRM